MAFLPSISILTCPETFYRIHRHLTGAAPLTGTATSRLACLWGRNWGSTVLMMRDPTLGLVYSRWKIPPRPRLGVLSAVSIATQLGIVGDTYLLDSPQGGSRPPRQSPSMQRVQLESRQRERCISDRGLGRRVSVGLRIKKLAVIAPSALCVRKCFSRRFVSQTMRAKLPLVRNGI